MNNKLGILLFILPRNVFVLQFTNNGAAEYFNTWNKMNKILVQKKVWKKMESNLFWRKMDSGGKRYLIF